MYVLVHSEVHEGLSSVVLAYLQQEGSLCSRYVTAHDAVHAADEQELRVLFHTLIWISA